MRAFILVSCLVVAALARPEAPLYNYNGLAQNQLGLLPNSHNNQPLIHQQLPEEHSFSNFAGSPHIAYNVPLEHNAPVEQQQQQQQQLQQDSYSMAHLYSMLPQGASDASAGYPYAPQETKIHKHIYVHVPPKDFEEEEAVQPRVHHQMGPKQKHYKIVFIKAPSAPVMRAPIIAPPPQNEEKTLIYVLHKKPDAAQDIIIPTAAPTKPSKPEVFFIKYKTKKEEAPVYGPPPTPVEMEPRYAEPSAEYGAPIAAAPEEYPQENNIELAAPITTLQPAIEEQPQQFVSEMPEESYAAPTMAAFSNIEEPQPTLAAPSNQYLLPEPIVAEEEHVPAENYGPPPTRTIRTRIIRKKK